MVFFLIAVSQNLRSWAVNHKAGEYVRGIHHTNSIQGHWSLLKRAIKGTHVHISSKHAWKYVAEFSYRRNMRHSHWPMFNLFVQALSRCLALRAS